MDLDLLLLNFSEFLNFLIRFPSHAPLPFVLPTFKVYQMKFIFSFAHGFDVAVIPRFTTETSITPTFHYGAQILPEGLFSTLRTGLTSEYSHALLQDANNTSGIFLGYPRRNNPTFHHRAQIIPLEFS